MWILMLGDIFGRPGRQAVGELLPALREERGIDFVIANGENAASGAGITPRILYEIVAAGVDVVTSGNHIYRQREIVAFMQTDQDRLIRPANYSPRSVGRGVLIRETGDGTRVAVMNLQGRVFMAPNLNPFDVADEILSDLEAKADVICVDFHAEATSEKKAMGWHLDGRVAAVVGTHTHVPTADETVLPGGTAYVTDLGMTGPHASCIGVATEIVLEQFLTGMPVRFRPATKDVRMQGVLLSVDPESGRARSIERVEKRLE
jgi:hypothetical protein